MPTDPRAHLQLALYFLTALGKAFETDKIYMSLSTIEIGTDHHVSAVKVWTAFLEHAWLPEEMAKGFLEDIFGRAYLAKYNKFDQMDVTTPEINGGILSDHLCASTAVMTTMQTKTHDLLGYFLLPMKNQGPNDIRPTVKVKQQSRYDFRNKALVRDKYRCLATGKWDREAIGRYVVPVGNDASGQPVFEKLDPAMTFPVLLQGAHILPHSLAHNINAQRFIARFTGGLIPRVEIFTDMINDYENALLLQADAHKDFDDYLWGIEVRTASDNITNIFRAVRIGNANCSVECERDLEFRGERDLPAPSALHLRLHLTVGRILFEAGLLRPISI